MTLPPDAPSPRFFRWINETGPHEVAAGVGVSYWTVISWRKGAKGQRYGSRPLSRYLANILRLAKGKLTAADIYPPTPPERCTNQN